MSATEAAEQTGSDNADIRKSVSEDTRTSLRRTMHSGEWGAVVFNRSDCSSVNAIVSDRTTGIMQAESAGIVSTQFSYPGGEPLLDSRGGKSATCAHHCTFGTVTTHRRS